MSIVVAVESDELKNAVPLGTYGGGPDGVGAHVGSGVPVIRRSGRADPGRVLRLDQRSAPQQGKKAPPSSASHACGRHHP
jgi:hypothetical protein